MTESAFDGLVVAAAIVDDATAPRRLLAARRTAPVALAGGWELAGGKVDPGEGPEAALHRELAEELGVEVELVGAIPGPMGGDWPLGTRRLRVWRAVLTAGVPRPLLDHDELRWLEPAEWASVDWLLADVGPVAALAAAAGHLDAGHPSVAAVTEHVLVVPDRADATELAERLLDGGVAAADVHREALAGDDDAEDAQWVVLVHDPGGMFSRASLERAVEDLDGWAERRH